MTEPLALVVDDEPQMVSIVTFTLETQGFRCLSARTVDEAWALVEDHRVALLVVDVMLPRGSGLELTRRVRARHPDVPIIVLSALGEENQRIAGLEAGAHDYVTKPFSPRELGLRAQNLVRFAAPAAADAEVSVGGLAADPVSAQAWWQGRRLPLSATEVRVLAQLMGRAGTVVTFTALLNESWATVETSGGREMIKTTVYRLRKKLTGAGLDPALITSVRGEGYVLTDPDGA